MRWRPVHFGLLVLQVFWLNVMLPGHQRGVVLLPGPEVKGDSHCGQRQAHACCAKRDGKKDSSSDRKARCAICAFAARLTIPPAPVLAPMLLERRPEAAVAVLRTMFSSDLPPAYWGRGPPMA